MKAYLRRVVVTVLFVAVAMVFAWLAVQAPDFVKGFTGGHPDLVIGRESYHKLRIGMSETDACAAIGKPPSYKGKLYGTWMPDLHWYATRSVDLGPYPGAKLYDHYQWNYGSSDVGSRAGVADSLYIGMLLEDGKVVCVWYAEEQQNPAEYAIEKLARKLRLNPSMLRHCHSEHSCFDPEHP